MILSYNMDVLMRPLRPFAPLAVVFAVFNIRLKKLVKWFVFGDSTSGFLF